MNKKPNAPFFIGLAVAVIVTWAVMSIINRQHISEDQPKPVQTVVSHRSQPKPQPATGPLRVYRVVVKGNQAQLEAVDAKAIPGKTPYESAILQLIKEGDGKATANPIPEGTKLLSLDVKNGLAKVNFSKEFQDNFNGGSEAESLTVDSILRTLGQFPEIKQVQILVEAKPLDSLGHLDLSKPLDVSGTGSDFGGKN